MSYRRRSTEEKLQIVLEVLTTKATVSEVCRRHNVSSTQFYDWRDRFVEGGKKALAGSPPNREVALQREVSELKELVGDLTIANNALKKAWAAKR